MAFCPKCGNPIVGEERFCAQCGSDVSGAAAATAGQSAGQSANPSGVPSQPAAYPPGATAPPPTAPLRQKKGTTRVVAAVAIVVLAGAYFYNRSHGRASPTGTQPISGAPSNTPSGLAAQQWLSVQWQNEGGTVMLTGAWTNNSAFTLASATAECDQTDSGGNLVTKNDVTLKGPLAPNAVDNFTRVRVGALSPGTTAINCVIVNVTRE